MVNTFVHDIIASYLKLNQKVLLFESASRSKLVLIPRSFLPLDSRSSIHHLVCDLLCESKPLRRHMHPVDRCCADIVRFLPTYLLYDHLPQDRAAMHVCARSPKRRGSCLSSWSSGNPMSDLETAN